jgi:hypothetical protein
MTHTVASIASAATTAETQRTKAARATGSSFADAHAAAVKNTKDKDTSTSADDKKTASVPKGERTQKVEGHNYVEIVSGPRNGMFINNTGTKRDGQAFLIVKRHGREFHVYGSGDDRKVFEVGRKRETGDAKDTSGASTQSGAATTGSGTTGASNTSSAAPTGTGTTPAATTTDATGTTSAT